MMISYSQPVKVAGSANGNIFSLDGCISGCGIADGIHLGTGKLNGKGKADGRRTLADKHAPLMGRGRSCSSVVVTEEIQYAMHELEKLL